MQVTNKSSIVFSRTYMPKMGMLASANDYFTSQQSRIKDFLKPEHCLPNADGRKARIPRWTPRGGMERGITGRRSEQPLNPTQHCYVGRFVRKVLEARVSWGLESEGPHTASVGLPALGAPAGALWACRLQRWEKRTHRLSRLNLDEDRR